MQEHLRLLREELGEEAELLERDSATLGRAARRAGYCAGRPAPRGRGGGRPAHRGAGGPRAQRQPGLRAGGRWRRPARRGPAWSCTCTTTGSCARWRTCFTRGEDCTRCHGRNTLPGVRLACRGDACRGGRLRRGPGALAAAPRRPGRPLRGPQRVRRAAAARAGSAAGRPRERRAPRGARLRGRLGRRLRDARPGRRPARAREGRRPGDRRLPRGRRAARGGGQRARGGEAPLARRRGRRALRGVGERGRAWPSCAAAAGLALVPSRSAETFGLAAAEAMAAGLPVVASRMGALPELVEPEGLVAPGAAEPLAAAIRARFGPGTRRPASGGSRPCASGSRRRAWRRRLPRFFSER